MLAWNRIGPGDTIILRAGTYSGNFVSTLNGTAELPITIRPYAGETAIIDGSLNINGNHIDLVDLIVTNSSWTASRDSIPTGQYPPQGGLNLSGIGNRAIGCIIHDTAGNGSWSANVGGGFTDCLIYNCGWLSPDRGHGHGIYTQNISPTQVHRTNIIWGQYGWGLHGYTESGQVDYLQYLNNISFRNGGRQLILGGSGGQRAHNGTIDGNVLLEGDSLIKATDLTLTNNYSPNGFGIDATSQNITQSGNTFAAPASGTNVFVYPRTTKAGWAHIAVFNWGLADSVQVDLSSVTGIAPGDTYRLHDATNYFDGIVTGTMPANKILTVDMVSHTIVARTGSTAVATPFPGFGAFVLEKA